MAGTQLENADGDDRGGLAAAILAEQIRLLASNRVDLPINLINASIVSAVLWPLYPAWVVECWLGLFCAVILARFLMRRHYRLSAPRPGMAAVWGRIFALNALATGCLWGLTGSVILVTPDPFYHVFIVFVLGGMLAGGIVSNAAYVPAMLSFLLPVVLPVVALLLSRPDTMQIEMGVMLALFAAVIMTTGRTINRSIIENFGLRIEQGILLVNVGATEAALAEAQAISHVGSWDIDLRTNSIVWSVEAFRIFGVDPSMFRPALDRFLARVHPDDRETVRKDFVESLAAGTMSGFDHRVVMDDGAIKWVHENGRTMYGADGRPLRAIGTVQDVTDRRHAEDALQFANILLKTQMEASPDGILVVNSERKVIAFNRRFSDMWNVPLTDLTAGIDETVLAKVISLVKDPEQFAARVKYLFDHPGEVGNDEVETTDGRFLERHTVTLHSPTLANLGRVWFFRDVTQRKQAAAQALRMARYDVLTGLANRSVFVESVQRAIAKAKRGEKGFAVLYLDLDHFKDVNDTRGHPVGDELLKAVASRLRSTTREIDTVARFGGDEFAVVVSEIGEPADAAMLADRVIDAFGDPFSIRDNDIRIGASIGIDLYGPEAPDPEALLSHADVALYRAKAEGRGTYRFFTDAMDAEVRTRVQLEAELRVAVASGQLFLLYQPQVALESGRMVGVEAMVRWRHPTRGVLEPEVFIPLAEKSGIVVKLGQWVLATACRQGKAWLDAGIAPFRIAVNVSAPQCKLSLAFESSIAATLAETGLPPHLLELELTESVMMEVSKERSEILRRLGQTGVTIAIDDFGTGYSSLDYLRRFPVDRIKIAQTFVTHLETIPGDSAIVRATISLARELGIMTIAEGVETRAQFDLLKGWGCGEVQGIYYSQPLTAGAIAAVVRDGGILQPRSADGECSQLQPTMA